MDKKTSTLVGVAAIGVFAYIVYQLVKGKKSNFTGTKWVVGRYNAITKTTKIYQYGNPNVNYLVDGRVNAPVGTVFTK